ncbi:MAG: hypothetical protein M3245_03690 [Actinomycetota bacterium]|nr:hypothetical protein [Actinomycetota bacterium]
MSVVWLYAEWAPAYRAAKDPRMAAYVRCARMGKVSTEGEAFDCVRREERSSEEEVLAADLGRPMFAVLAFLGGALALTGKRQLRSRDNERWLAVPIFLAAFVAAPAALILIYAGARRVNLLSGAYGGSYVVIAVVAIVLIIRGGAPPRGEEVGAR